MGYGWWDWGKQISGGGRGTSKDSGEIRPRSGGSVWAARSILPPTLLRVASECMVVVKSTLALSFVITFKFSTDNVPSLLRVPRTNYPLQRLPTGS